jgi:hypothetical protein
MPENTWEILGKPTMIPSLGGIGFFKGKMINLCGRLTHVPMIAHEHQLKKNLGSLSFLRITLLLHLC